MLEVVNLTKIYKTKGGADVKALDDISLQFPETGMVFLLGKSGSGKSTLLNVCGGLDSPTSGEIIVKGRSSKRFSQSDFDSYRNTYVGFIFQEYNILNEFTVEDNIGLALELQGKSKDKKAIEALLEEVDLAGYARRNPHTLSGGQKQRIAIARALIKSPQIIMADEPSGALDSATGKQVFDTLKKLSKHKLVIVVSHDKEFAEQYGDRIIELKDGKVISDVTKTIQQQHVLTENLHVIGDVLCLKKGSELSEQDFEEIKTFLKNSDNDVIIASGEQNVQAFKEVSRISDEGAQEIFKETDENEIPKKTYTPSDSRFIRSKLPIRHAAKIGVSSMGHKPVRLCFTMLLCTIAFIFFGLLSTMSFYDSKATYEESMDKVDIPIVRLGIQYTGEERWYAYGELEMSYETTIEGKFTEDDLAFYQEKFGSDIFGGFPSYSSISVGTVQGYYWSNSVSAMGYLPENHSLRDTLTGTYPTKDNEICISSYFAKMLYTCKPVNDNGVAVELRSPEDILGKTILVDNQAYTVTGIFESGKLAEKYEILKTEAGSEDYLLLSEYMNTLADGLHQMVFLTENKVTSSTQNTQYYEEEMLYYHSVSAALKSSANEVYNFPVSANAAYLPLTDLKKEQNILWFDSGKTELTENELVLSAKLFCEYMSAIDNKTYDMKKDIETLVERVKNENISFTLGLRLFNSSTGELFGDTKEFKITGITEYIPNSYDISSIYLADSIADALWEEQRTSLDYYLEFVSDYTAQEGEKYSSLFISYEKKDSQKELIWDILQGNELTSQGATISVYSSLLDTLALVDAIVEILSNVFLYVGIVLAVFAALLFSNFISVSISYKKREIGILRAVGARSLDVFKIFFSESFVIALICVVLAFLGSQGICGLLNRFLASEFGTALFVFGPKSWIVLSAIAMSTAVIATFLPVWNAARKKPVESIRSL